MQLSDCSCSGNTRGIRHCDGRRTRRRRRRRRREVEEKKTRGV
jgi:hypothetical protein